MILLVRVWQHCSSLLDLHSSLTGHTGGAADRAHQVPHGAPLYVVPLPGLLPEQQGGDAGEDEAQQAAHQTTLPQVTSRAIGEAGETTETTATWAAVVI